jgi:hypothetical protein
MAWSLAHYKTVFGGDVKMLSKKIGPGDKEDFSADPTRGSESGI